MKCNVGKTDRIIRIILGLAVMALGFYYNSWWGVAGIIPVLTAMLSWCPFYVPFGLSTCANKS